MASVRVFVALVLLAAACALVICASGPRQAPAMWVGGVHASTVVFFG